MKEIKGKNQTYARISNNQTVMRILRERPCSATMLSELMQLSNASLTSILNELSANGFIKEADGAAPQKLGRRQVFYTVNENFGYVVVISMSDYLARVVVSDMRGEIVDSAEMPVERYDLAMLYELIILIKDLVGNKKYDGIPLLGLDVAVPGRVNTETDELQLSPHFDRTLFQNGNTLKTFLEDKFGVPVRINNDINLALLGESRRGALRDVRNGMVAHVDVGIGGAFLFDGRLFAGEQGYAGEFGMMRTYFNGHFETLDEFVSLRGIMEEWSRRTGKLYKLDEIFAMYETDAELRSYILATASCLGKVFKDVVELLNVPQIVLSGRVQRFGSDYLDAVCSELEQSRNRAVVRFSALNADAVIVGAITKAVFSLTDHILEKNRIVLQEEVG